MKIQGNENPPSFGVAFSYPPKTKNAIALPTAKRKPEFFRIRVSGRNRTRTCDPIDVNDVLYQLSHATITVNM